ncbi:MAG TPA: energy-coupling factor transporter transmembrane component T [Rhizobiaceae bacterium]|nr:energy-coupling factor transporter transmembrane component T [Rhizobiaceae bacterium]
MLTGVHPLAKLCICLVWIAAAIVVFDARFQLVTILICSLALVLLERKSPFTVLALMLPFALFGFGFLTTSVLFRNGSDFAQRMAQESPFTSEAFSAGLVLFLRAIACGMVSALFALTTDPARLIKALMVGWRLPPRIGYSLFSVLQLVPDLAAEAQQIRLARAMKHGRPPRRFPGPIETVTLLIPLLAYAIRRANRAAIAMEARGLAADTQRTLMSAPKPGRGDVLFVATTLSTLGLLLAWVSLVPV